MGFLCQNELRMRIGRDEKFSRELKEMYRRAVCDENTVHEKTRRNGKGKEKKK